MSIARDVGQLCWLGFEGQSVPGWLHDEIAAGEVGAVVLFKRNLVVGDDGRVDLDHLVALNRALHDAATDVPVRIAVDQEGGRVARIREPATVWPAMLAFDRSHGEEDALARDVGHAMGTELAALGFDIDFAPVLDVHTNPDNPIIGDRAFSAGAERAARLALAFADGLAAAGILGCGKHFPGHGDTDTDSHLALPRLAHDMDRLRRVELVPFAAAAERGLPMIMTAHVVFEAIDPSVPATLSRAVIHDLLRTELGYRGVVVSDDLDMKAIADHVGVGEAAVAAIRAGCDALLLCRRRDHQLEAREALCRAAESDAALRERIAEAAGRIRSLNVGSRAATRPALDRVGCAAHRELAARLRGSPA